MHPHKFRPPVGAHEKTAFTTAKPPYQGNRGPRPPVPQEPPRNLAPAIRLKNFRHLLAVIGEDDLAVALDLTLHRVKELGDGVNFSNETTHHIETILGLASGFLDQVNPTLTDADVQRIKAMEPIEEDDEPTPVVKAAPAPQVAQATPSVQESPAVVVPAAVEPTLAASSVTTPVETQTAKETPMTLTQATATHEVHAQAAMPVSAEDALREVRRMNLLALTSRPGSKTALSRLTGLSPANISHRLHGNKIFDLDTANFFCEKLSLPMGWFETPKTPEDVPAQTLTMLSNKDIPMAESPVAANKAPRAARKPRAVTPPTPAPTKAQVSLSSASLGKPAAPAVAAPAPVVAAPVAPAAPVATAPATVVKAPKAAPAPVAARPAAPVVAPVMAAPGFTAQEALAAEAGAVGPIAEALVRILAAKSRAGSLTEERALQLLVEIAAL